MKRLKDMTLEERKAEYRTLLLKIDPSKGHMQGLTDRELDRGNTLYFEFESDHPKHENYCAHEFKNLRR